MYQKLKTAIKTIGKPIIHIFLHHNADPDALCSAYALKQLCLSINQSIEIKLFTDGLNVSSKRVVEEFNIQLEKNVTQEVPGLIMTVDTSNLSQLGKFQQSVVSSNTPLIYFDHHDTSEIEKEKQNILVGYYDADSPSTCLMMINVFKNLKIDLPAKIATALICGHIYDSRRFMHNTTATELRSIAELIELGGDYQAANELLQNAMPLGERIARLKSARRLNYKVITGNLVVVSQVGAFESSAARSMIGMGADVVMVIAKKEREIRGSARTKISETVSMGDIMTKIAKEWRSDIHKATGGGHKGAAGLNISPSLSTNQIKKVQNRFLELVEQEIMKQSPSSI
ncbi:MAG: DHH family phosphoesterase [Candidatus Heimdallarchaeota archaeon]|nr:DHH family phosphoesterase [Candidatus Heimdallarchaeota archaeon]